MKTLSSSAVGALLFGLIAYFAIRWLFPPISIEHFTNVIGLVAMVGAAAGAWWSHRRAKSRPDSRLGKDQTGLS